MKILVKWLLTGLVPLLLATGCLAETYTAGKEYIVLSNPQPTNDADKIEVVELFWYGCPHCYQLEPFVAQWKDKQPEDVEFIQMPAVLGKGWELLAKGYYTAELLNVSDKTHTALFKVLHVDKKKITNEASLQKIFAGQGVSAEDFSNTFNSFAVSVKLNNAKLMTKRYAITGVPAIIINGKYSTGASQAGGNENVFRVVDYLVAQERSQLAVPAAPAMPAVITAPAVPTTPAAPQLK
jgi:thiol:disulfide interchange protein DsbA